MSKSDNHTDRSIDESNNIKCNLDSILGLEQITVSESLIQATLKKANQQKQCMDFNENTIQQDTKLDYDTVDKRKKINTKKLFKISALAACAACSVIILMSINPNYGSKQKSDEQESSMSDTVYENAKAEVPQDEAGEEIMNATIDSKTSGESPNEVTKLFDVVTEDGLLTIQIDDIKDITIKDLSMNIDETVTSAELITKIYEALMGAEGNVQDCETMPEAQSYTKYSRQYIITAKEDRGFKKLYVWVPMEDVQSALQDNTDQDLPMCQIERQIIFETGECKNQFIDNVDMKKLDRLLDTK